MKLLGLGATGTAIRTSTLDVVDAHIAAVETVEAFALNEKDAAVSDVARDRAKIGAEAAYAAFLETLFEAVEHLLTVSEVDGTPVSSDAVRSLALVPGAQPTRSAKEIKDKVASVQRDLTAYATRPGVAELVEVTNDVLARNTTALFQRLARPLGISLTLPEEAQSERLALLKAQRAGGAAGEPASAPSAVPSAPASSPAPAPGDGLARAERAVWAAFTGFRADFHALTSSQQAKLNHFVVLGRVRDARGKPQPVQLGYDATEREHGILVGDHDFYDINKSGELRALLQSNLAAGIPIDQILTTLFDDVAEHLRAARTPSPTLYTWPRTPVPSGLGDREPGFILEHARAFRDRFGSRIPSLANPTLRECAIDGVVVSPAKTGKHVRAGLLFERGNLWLTLDGQVAADLIQPSAELWAIIRAQDGTRSVVGRAITQMMDEAARKFIASDMPRAEDATADDAKADGQRFAQALREQQAAHRPAPAPVQRAALLSPPPGATPVAVPKETRRVRAGTSPASGGAQERVTPWAGVKLNPADVQPNAVENQVDDLDRALKSGPVSDALASSAVRPWTPPAMKERYEPPYNVVDEARDILALFASIDSWAQETLRVLPAEERKRVVEHLPTTPNNVDTAGNFGPVRATFTEEGVSNVVIASEEVRHNASGAYRIERFVRAYNTLNRSVAAVILKALRASADAIETRVRARVSGPAAGLAPGPAAPLPFVPGNMKLMAGAGYEGQADAVFAAVTGFQHWLQQLVAGAKNPKQLADFIIGSDFAYTVVGADAGNHSVRIAVDRDLRCTLGFDDRRVDRRAELATLLARYPETSTGIVKGLESLFTVASRKLMQRTAP